MAKYLAGDSVAVNYMHELYRNAYPEGAALEPTSGTPPATQVTPSPIAMETPTEPPSGEPS